MVGEVPGNVLGMVADLAHKLQQGVITPGQLGRFLKKENPFEVGDYSEPLADWQEFWRELRIELDTSAIRIPECPGKGWRLLIIADIALEALYAECAKRFPCWRWTSDNLDKIVVQNERTAENGAYAIWVKNNQEADENLKNFSANDIKKKCIITETLAERLIHERKFFEETGRHLDEKRVTICSGSRYADGRVPNVD